MQDRFYITFYIKTHLEFIVQVVQKLPLHEQLMNYISLRKFRCYTTLRIAQYQLSTAILCTDCTLFVIYYDPCSDLEQSILAVDTPQWRHYCSRSHHTQCPTHCSYRSPLCPHWECLLQPVAIVHLRKELCKVQESFQLHTDGFRMAWIQFQRATVGVCVQ